LFVSVHWCTAPIPAKAYAESLIFLEKPTDFTDGANELKQKETTETKSLAELFGFCRLNRGLRGFHG
jgi:hypothetical protein